MSEYTDRLDKYVSKIDAILIDAMSSSEKSGIYWQGLMRQIRENVQKIEMLFIDNLEDEVEKSYRESLSKNLERLRSLKSLPRNIKNQLNQSAYTDILNMDKNRNKINNIVRTAMNDFFTSVENKEKRINNYFNEMQKLNIKIYENGESEAIKYSSNRHIDNMKDTIKKEIRKISKDGKYIQVIDEKGRQRNYNINQYSTMLTEYYINQANAQAAIDTSLYLGSDLVQIDFHNTLCPICLHVEGKIYSISGADKDFPLLDFSLPLHPWCYHTLHPQFRETLEIRGIQKFIDYSNDKLNPDQIQKIYPSWQKYKDRTPDKRNRSLE